MTHQFCTYFDSNYLARGIALYRSLIQHCASFRLWVLCMDSTCYDALVRLNLPQVELICLGDFERGDESLLRAKQNRSRIEYYFTCTPSLPLYILNRFSEPDLITYLDADLFFYADPGPIFDNIGNCSIAIIEHHFPPFLQDQKRFGIYNVGWLTFRRDNHAFECLRWWRDQCNEWCYARPEAGRSADQKYLDDWPTRFENLVVIQHKGANLAPWNIANYNVVLRDGHVCVDDQPLVFFHFHGLKLGSRWLYDPCLEPYGAHMSDPIRYGIFIPYVHLLEQTVRELAPNVDGVISVRRDDWLQNLRGKEGDLGGRGVAKSLKSKWKVFHNMLDRKYIFVIGRNVF